MSDIVKDKVAFDIEEGGYRFFAWYLSKPKADALVEITKGGEAVKSFLWPAYKIWNIAAHARDIAEDLNTGLAVAGSDGLGGGVAPQDITGGPHEHRHPTPAPLETESMKTRHVDSTSPERTRRALAYGRIKGRERAMVDLRDDEGPVSEIMRAATEVEMAYHDLGRFATKPHLDRWLAARLELRKIASRIVYGMDVEGEVSDD